MRALKGYVEAQCDRVEALLAAHKAPGRVTRGTVGPRLVRLVLQPAPFVRFKQVERLRDDLALALRVPHLTVKTNREGIILEFDNPQPRAVRFLDLLTDVQPLPISSALVGICDDGKPLVVRLAAPDVAHILVSGTTGAGKSILLSTLAASLIATHTPSTLRLLLIDPKRKFETFAGSPLLTRPPIVDVNEAIGALHDAMRVVELRDNRREYPPQVPRIVIVIDELADLVNLGGGSVTDVIGRLAARGREAGVHLIAATQHPAAAILGSVMRANFPLRLVGRVVSTDDARVAAGCGGTNAHLLSGRGDFLAVGGGAAETVRFQAARVTAEEIGQLCQKTAGSRLTGLAQGQLQLKATTRPTITALAEEPRERDRVQEAVDVLGPQWPELREAWLGNEWGIKSRLVDMVWSGHRAEGAFKGWIEKAVDILETRRMVQTTALVPAGGAVWQTG